LLSIPVIIYPIKTVFSSNCPTIVIKQAGTTLSPTLEPSTSTSKCTLNEDERTQLNEGTYTGDLFAVRSCPCFNTLKK